MPKKTICSLAFMVINLLGCTDNRRFNPDKLDLSEIVTEDSLKQRIISHWEGIVDACPGIRSYQHDLSIDGIMSYYDGRVEIALKVSDRPISIPEEFKASRHVCHFTISANGDTLNIGKRACTSLCKESVIDQTPLNIPL